MFTKSVILALITSNMLRLAPIIQYVCLLSGCGTSLLVSQCIILVEVTARSSWNLKIVLFGVWLLYLAPCMLAHADAPEELSSAV